VPMTKGEISRYVASYNLRERNAPGQKLGQTPPDRARLSAGQIPIRITVAAQISGPAATESATCRISSERHGPF
jgi:hypothetical protein